MSHALVITKANDGILAARSDFMDYLKISVIPSNIGCPNMKETRFSQIGRKCLAKLCQHYPSQVLILNAFREKSGVVGRGRGESERRCGRGLRETNRSVSPEKRRRESERSMKGMSENRVPCRPSLRGSPIPPLPRDPTHRRTTRERTHGEPARATRETQTTRKEKEERQLALPQVATIEEANSLADMIRNAMSKREQYLKQSDSEEETPEWDLMASTRGY